MCSSDLGIAIARADDTLPELMTRADQTLYEVKRHGKGTWRIASSDVNGATAEVAS